MIKRESKFISFLLRPFIRSKPLPSSCPVEAKQCTDGEFPFAALKEHQIDALRACKSDEGFLYKISDESTGYKPFDLAYFRNAPMAIVSIRYPGFFCMIDIDAYMAEWEESKKRTLSAERAKAISFQTVAC